jgi:hypothetical protein
MGAERQQMTEPTSPATFLTPGLGLAPATSSIASLASPFGRRGKPDPASGSCMDVAQSDSEPWTRQDPNDPPGRSEIPARLGVVASRHGPEHPLRI